MEKHILIPRQVIQARVQSLAQEVADSHLADNAILIPVLEGASRFASDISHALFALGLDLQQSSIKISSYGYATESSRKPKVDTHMERGQYQGRTGILAEDLLHTGFTIQEALSELKQEAGFDTVLVMCLLAKEGAQEVVVPLDFVGFTIADLWVEGYGIDTSEKGRGNDNIMYIEQKNVSEKSRPVWFRIGPASPLAKPRNKTESEKLGSAR